MSDSSGRWLSVAEAAAHIGIGESTYYEHVKDGTLPAARFRGRLLVDRLVLDELLERLNRASIKDAS